MLSRLACWIWGHAVQNEVYQHGERACTPCGRRMLRDGGAVSRSWNAAAPSASTRAAPAATRSSFVGAGAARSSGGP